MVLARTTIPASCNSGVATLLVAVGVLGYRLLQTKARYQKLEADQAALKEQLRLQSGLANNGPQDHGKSVTPLDATAPVATDLSRNDQTNVELAKALTDRATVEARAKSLEDQL